MKKYNELSYKEKNVRTIILTIILSFTIFIPNYSLWFYIPIMSIMVFSIIYNYLKHRNNQKK